MKRLIAVLLLWQALFFICCAGTEKKPGEMAKQPFYYNLDKPEKTWHLPSVLKEVSGISWVDSAHLLAIEDEHPFLYVLNIRQNVFIEKTIEVFEKKVHQYDWEDVTLAGDTAWVVGSPGDIYSISKWNKRPKVKKHSTFLSKHNDPEGICFDPWTKDLLVACKSDPGIKGKRNHRAVYPFDTDKERLGDKPLFLIAPDDLKKKAKKRVDFNPSSIAVHPVTGDIYILSTLGSKCLLQLNRSGKIISVQFIDNKLLPQPEGICFSPQGLLYISSEGKEGAGLVSVYSSVKPLK